MIEDFIVCLIKNMGKFVIIESLIEPDRVEKNIFAFQEDKMFTADLVLKDLLRDKWVLSYKFTDDIGARTYHSYNKFLQWLSKTYFGL